MEKPARRLNASRARLSWLVVACLGAYAAVACGDDDTGGDPTPTTGGGGAATQAGTAGRAGSAGTPTTAGSSAMGGTAPASAGQGGEAGQPQLPPAGEACVACGDTECTDTLQSCRDSAECAPWLGCVGACDDAACIATCDADHAEVARLYAGIYDCLCDSCKDDCNVASACEKTKCVDDAPLPPTTSVPATLAETGLYAGYASGEGGAGGGAGASGAPELEPGVEPLTLAGYVQGFEPKYPLWADGLKKDRFVYIPKCSTIDTSDMDHWRFPVGTRFWKQFSVVEGVGVAATTKRIETRMMHHFGPGQADWLYAAYQWDVAAPDDPAAAVSVPAGVINASGSTHDIPATGQCIACHGGLSEKVLGFGAIQLSHDSAAEDLTIEKISTLGWLTDPAPQGFAIPGTAVEQAALGYLHGNCGGCHFQGTGLGSSPTTNGNTPLVMRMLVGQTAYADTDAVKSTVGVLVGSANAAITGKPRIDPMEPGNSALLLRMKDRGTALQMPPQSTTSTKLPDTAGGIADVTAWVNTIPKVLP